MKNLTAKSVKSWKANSPAAFYQWLTDIQPRILTRAGRYEVFQPTDDQRSLIDEILKSQDGRFVHTISLNTAPRRHSKSTTFALITTWLFTSRKNFTAMLLGSSELHCRRTMFNMISSIIRNTPILAAAIPESDVHMYEIKFKPLGNVIQLAPSNLSAVFGGMAQILWVSDLHSAVDLAPFNALQASLLDSEDSLCFIDSNVDFIRQTVHGLQQEAETDDTMFSRYTSYKDFTTSPPEPRPGLTAEKAKRLERTTLPVDYKRDILGQRATHKMLFSSPAEIIDRCRDTYKIPVLDPRELAGNRKYKIPAPSTSQHHYFKPASRTPPCRTVSS